MTLKLHKNGASAITGRNAGRPFFGLLLMMFGLFSSFFQPAVAQPYNFTAVTIVNDQVADGASNDVVQVYVTYASGPNAGQPANGVQVDFQLAGTGVGQSFLTGPAAYANGYAEFLANSTIPQTTSVEVTVNGVNQFVAITWVPGPPSAAQSNIVAIVTPQPADGVSQDAVEAIVKTQFGYPVANGTVVTFTIETGTATIVLTTTTVNGLAAAYFTSTVVGSVQVQATVNGGPPFLNDLNNPANNYVTIQFVPPPPSLANSYIAAVITPMPADGVSQDEVQATVLNSLGQPVPAGTAVTFTIETGTATITTTGITNASGVATAFFTSTVVGSVQVQAQVSINGTPTYLFDQANPANNFVTIQFVNPPPSAANSFIVAVITPQPADGVSQDEVQATVLNSLGQPVPAGTAVTFTIETGTATITTTGLTNASGVATAFFTSTVVGSVQVQAQVSIGGVPTFLTDQANPTNNYVTIQFVTPPPSAANSYIVAVITPVAADGASQDEVQATVLNSLGQPVPAGTAVTFTIETGTATIITTGITNASGVATAFFTSMVVGSVQVQAQVSISGVPTYLNDQANPLNNYVTIAFVAGPPVSGNPGGGGSGGGNPGGGGSNNGGSGPGGNNGGSGSNGGFTILFVTQDNRLADGVQQDSVYAYITDANKNPVPGVSVTFFIQSTPASGTITSGDQIIGSTTLTTNSNGIAGIGVISTMPGTAFVDATIVDPATGNTVLIDGSYQIVTFDTKPDTTNILTALHVIVPEALADGIQQTEVSAHVVDLNGNVMAGQEVTFSIDSGSGTIVTPQPVMTDANGDAFIYITSTKPGYVLITATVDGEQIIFGSPARVQFAPINIYVPRVFTPNGDGTNDILKPILVGISTFHYMSIYNRWGNLIFTTQDPNQGWDGTFRGVPQPVETYLWIAEGIDENGRKIVAKGMVSLVR
jgi:gliding motility-associated-like protein